MTRTLKVKVKNISSLAKEKINYYPVDLISFWQTFTKGKDDDIIDIEFSSVIEFDKAKEILNLQ
ncbi:hypothetical protein [Paenibacillus sp. FSL H3-0333]|uniref:hypothetical protein n=1 Tax=Paenibacillus sp. FSL H3-0333 TaxID=2921373 RepID=UPI0030F63EDE